MVASASANFNREIKMFPDPYSDGLNPGSSITGGDLVKVGDKNKIGSINYTLQQDSNGTFFVVSDNGKQYKWLWTYNHE